MMFDYETLRLIWWLLMGSLLVLFAIMDGIDLGVAMMLLAVSKTDIERRLVLNTIGPTWEGNQVWLILGGGAIFAAWPTLYSVSFSGFYFAMFMILIALILRPVGFKYRSKLESMWWRQMWDIGLFLSGLIPSFLFGVALGNVLQGVPFHFDEMLHISYTGSLWQLLNPFALSCGLVSVAMLLTQGGIYLAIKTTGSIQQRAAKTAFFSAIIFFLLFAINGFWVKHGVGYILNSPAIPNGPSNPTYKAVSMQIGAWMQNYQHFPISFFIPLIGLGSALICALLVKLNLYRTSLLINSFAIACTIATVGYSMFPFILPSSSHPSMSLLLWDSSSSQMTLFIMLIASIIFLPLIFLYTGWVYRVLRGKVTLDYVKNNSKNLY